MMLEDVRVLAKSFGIAEYVYKGKLDHKKEKSFGVYHSKHTDPYKTAIGGPALNSYGMKHVTLLVHWNKSPDETERAAKDLFDAILKVKDATINETKIKFIQPLYEEPVSVDTDENGIYEMVIEAAVVYEKGR